MRFSDSREVQWDEIQGLNFLKVKVWYQFFNDNYDNDTYHDQPFLAQ